MGPLFGFPICKRRDYWNAEWIALQVVLCPSLPGPLNLYGSIGVSPIIVLGRGCSIARLSGLTP